MPSATSGKVKMTACDATHVYRAWMEAHSVRRVAISCDRLFESSVPSDKNGHTTPVKFTIKDSIHNQYVLIPLLERMAEHPGHPLPYIKPLAKEFPILLAPANFFLFIDIHFPDLLVIFCGHRSCITLEHLCEKYIVTSGLRKGKDMLIYQLMVHWSRGFFLHGYSLLFIQNQYD